MNVLTKKSEKKVNTQFSVPKCWISPYSKLYFTSPSIWVKSQFWNVKHDKKKHFSQLTFSSFKKMDEHKQLNILILCSDDSISLNLFRNSFPLFLKKDQVQSYLSIHFRFVYVQSVCNYSIKLDTCLALLMFPNIIEKTIKTFDFFSLSLLS